MSVFPPVLVGLAYVLGATPTSYWVGRLLGVDLRTRGSGNLGATNAFRVLGARAAAPVIVVDVLKGWFPVWWFPRVDDAAASWAFAYAIAAVVGHMFSFWVGFRGGKGVATSGGALLALAPVATGVAFVAWAAVTALSRMVSLGSLVAAVTVPAVVATRHGPGSLLTFTVALAGVVLWAHRANLARILSGTENRLGRSSVGEEEANR